MDEQNTNSFSFRFCLPEIHAFKQVLKGNEKKVHRDTQFIIQSIDRKWLLFVRLLIFFNSY